MSDALTKENTYTSNIGSIADFVEDKEITVTITLAEYRALVTSQATSAERIRKETEKIHVEAKRVRELESRIERMLSVDADEVDS